MLMRSSNGDLGSPDFRVKNAGVFVIQDRLRRLIAPTRSKAGAFKFERPRETRFDKYRAIISRMEITVYFTLGTAV